MAALENSQKHLVVLGAGVIGLTVAYLAATDPDVSFTITVVARDMPEDMNSQSWATPFAGANWFPLPVPAGASERQVHNWELVSFAKFWDMISTGLVKKLPTRVYSKRAMTGSVSELWWNKVVRELRDLDPSEIPEGYNCGFGFYTVSVNPQEYIPWLKDQLSSRGVSFQRQEVRSLEELRPLVGPKGFLVNASSLGSKSIIGVEDTKLYPIRGQAILIQSPEIRECLFVQGEEDTLSQGGEATYMIPRPGTKHADTILLGGTFQSGNWDTSIDMDVAQRIFERCAEFAPSLRDSEVTKILRHQVGLRPGREGGARVEAEVVKFPLKHTHNLVPWVPSSLGDGSMQVVHAYGFGAGGYQASWGAAAEVLDLIKARTKVVDNDVESVWT